MQESSAVQGPEALSRRARSYGLKMIYLFGSQARLGFEYLAGKDPILTDPLADLDVGVVRLGEDLTPMARADLYGALSLGLQGLFKPFNVDLVLLEETHSVFQTEAISGICVYAEDQELREDYAPQTLSPF